MKIIRKKLTPDEMQPANMRYDSDCDCIQTTYDDGATWVNTPLSDPRTAPFALRPPNTGVDPQCLAAEGMKQAVSNFVAKAQTDITTTSLAIDLLSILSLLIPEAGLFTSLLFGIAGGLLDIGASAIDASFTDAVYDQLLCSFYDNIGSDGQMSDAQASAILADIDAHYDVTVQAVMGLMFSAYRNVSFSNAGATFSGIADCSACVPCSEFLNGHGAGDMSARGSSGGHAGAPRAVYDAVLDIWHGQEFTGCTFCDVFLPTGTWVSMDITTANNGGCGGANTIEIYAANTSPTPQNHSGNVGSGTYHFDFSPPIVGSASGDDAWVRILSDEGDPDGLDVTITELTLCPS